MYISKEHLCVGKYILNLFYDLESLFGIMILLGICRIVECFIEGIERG